jgi:hypothetical protein
MPLHYIGYYLAGHVGVIHFYGFAGIQPLAYGIVAIGAQLAHYGCAHIGGGYCIALHCIALLLVLCLHGYHQYLLAQIHGLGWPFETGTAQHTIGHAFYKGGIVYRPYADVAGGKGRFVVLGEYMPPHMGEMPQMLHYGLIAIGG